jgi:CheY-like chemotaxis protein
MPKILVVDDTPQTRGLIASILVLERFEVVMAADGFEGIERARSELPDLIITELNMPRLPGVEMIKMLRVDPNLKSVPILAITSHDMETAMEAVKAGANRALATPVEEHLLLAFVFDLLAKKEYSHCQ